MSLLAGLAALFARPIHRESNLTPFPSNRWLPFTPLTTGLDASPLTLPSFRAAVDRKAGLFASMPTYVAVDGVRLPDDQIPQLLRQPDPTEHLFTTLHKMSQSFVYHGEVVAPITSWEQDGSARSLVVVDPDLASLSSDGSYWTIGGMVWPRWAVMHLVRFPLPGVMRGVGAVALYRDFFEGIGRQEAFQREFYTEGGIPSVIVTMEEEAGEDELREAKAAWIDKTRKREPIFVPHTSRAETFQLSNVDQQYIETKAGNLQEFANIVGIPGAYVGAPAASQVYQNIQDTRRELVDVYLRPDIILIEAGLTSMIIDVAAKLDTNALLRTDPAATAALLTAELAYKTMNEVRAELRLPPVAGGDVIGSAYVAVAEARRMIEQNGGELDASPPPPKPLALAPAPPADREDDGAPELEEEDPAA